MNDPITITLDRETWEGVLFHLKDTVEHIPISTIQPDPWQCVTTAIEALDLYLGED